MSEQNTAAAAAQAGPTAQAGPAGPVVVIGAGPVGLAAAAHLAERGVDFLVLESGPGVAAAIEEWRHVKLFSPWRYDIDSAARRLLEQADWAEPDLAKLPTGGDLIDSYLAPLAKTPAAERPDPLQRSRRCGDPGRIRPRPYCGPRASTVPDPALRRYRDPRLCRRRRRRHLAPPERARWIRHPGPWRG